MNKGHLLYFAISIFLVGCDSSSGPGHRGVLMPLAVGNEWHYLLEHYDSTGTNITVTGPTDIVLIDTIQVNGYTWYQDSTTGAYTNKEDGLYEGFSFLTDWRDRLILPYPSYVGVSVDTTYPNSNIWRVTVINRDTLITVPAGSFLCCMFYEDYISPEFDYSQRKIHYYALNQGMIRRDEYHMKENGAWSLDHRYLLTRLVKR